MTLSEMRPRVSWSSVANCRANNVGDVLADLQAVRHRRVEGQQGAVEPGRLVRLRQRLDVGAVDDRTTARNGFGRVVVTDKPDEFGHRLLLAGVLRSEEHTSE